MYDPGAPLSHPDLWRNSEIMARLRSAHITVALGVLALLVSVPALLYDAAGGQARAWGAALVRRAGRAGLPTPEPLELTARSPEELGERLLGVVAAATAHGWDVEDALREAVRRYAGELDVAAEARGR